MNLALHGFLLQVFLSILNFHHGRLLCSAGEPGYLDFDNLPETNFSCQGKVIGGYYADVEAGCQMFHVCTIGQKDEIMDIKFLCLNGTVFDQETRVCERVDEVDCSKSERFYNLNLELYGNNAMTLSLHENGDDEDDLSDPVEVHQPRTTSARPSTTSTTSTTTSRPNKPSTTAASGSFQHPAGYPQHYQPQPPFPQVHTSQSKSLYDDKNGGYHHQYILHIGGERANNQATSYQLFSNQGAVSSTTVQPSPAPQIHQIRYSSTVGPPQIIHNEPSTVTPLFHATSSTIQTLLNSNANNPTALINPIFHNHGIASTTEQFTVHSNNPRETSDYRDEGDQNVSPLEAIQPTNKGKISKLTLTPIPNMQELSRTMQTQKIQKSKQQQQQRISSNFLPTPATVETTIRSFYPTPRPSPKPSQSSQSVLQQVSQQFHVSSDMTIHLLPPDFRRIVQNPSPLLPSQSRVIVTAKASISDESGRPLNTTQLVTLPLPTIPASYDDYKEGDESFDPFYRDVPKIRKNRRVTRSVIEKMKARRRRSLSQPYHFIYGVNNQNGDLKMIQTSTEQDNKNNAMNDKNAPVEIGVKDFQAIKESLMKFRDILFSDEIDDDSFRNVAEVIKNNTKHITKDNKTFDMKSVKQTKDNTIKKLNSLEDLKTEASKHLNLNREDDEEHEDINCEESSSSVENNTEKLFDEEKMHVKDTLESEHKTELEINTESITALTKKNKSQEDIIDVIILDSDNDFKAKSTSASANVGISNTEAPIEIIIEEETKSGSHDVLKTNEKAIQNGRIAEYLTKDELEKQSSSITGEEKQLEVPQETTKRKTDKDSRERKSGSRRKDSRSRSSRKRISSRIKQQRSQYVEVTEAFEQKEEIDVTTIASTIFSTTTSTTTALTTAIPSVAPSEAEVVEQIDIFEQPETQTSKEVGTRAVGEHDATYSKSLQDSKSYDASKSKEIERSFDHQIMEDYARNLEQYADESKEEEEEGEEEQKTESTDYTQSINPEDTNFTENPQNAEETGSIEITHVSEEKESSNEEFSSKEYETLDDESITNTNYEQSKESSEEKPNKISSHEVAISHESIQNQEQSPYHENESEKSSTDNLDEAKHSIMEHSEEMNSEKLNEYQDTTESSAENEHNANVQEDYKESESIEDSTTPADYVISEDYTDYQEDIVNTTEETESNTEGILKFTDELPKSDHKDDMETKEVSEPDEIDVNDYVDDNYEPENYMKIETTTKANDYKEENNKRNDEEIKNATTKDDDNKKNIEIHQIDDSVEAKTQTEYVEDVTEVADLQEVMNLTMTTTAVSTTSTTMSTTTSTTTSTTMSTSTTTKTTPRPTTTTTRATPPKLFKPTGARRFYAYVPPTTTPLPVVIKPRMGLYNPKPAKPPKSYNELAPKPVIRKLVLSRKPATTTTTTTEKLNVENPETTTEPVIMTTTITTTTPTTTAPMTTITTESGKSEENILESKLEVNEPISLNPSIKSDQTNKEDQLSSPSEQDSSSNSSKDIDSRISIKENETFITPYPLFRLSTLSPSVEQTTKEIEMKLQETTEEIEILTTSPLLTTLPFKEYKDVEETSTDRYPEEVETTIASTKIDRQDLKEIPSITSEYPTLVSAITTFEPKRGDSISTTESAFFRPNNRKSTNSRKHTSFNCLEKEMYRFYGDTRDCRLFHYCSPGFTLRQALDFRFVCEEGTAFDEETQSCRHDVRNRKCRNRSW